VLSPRESLNDEHRGAAVPSHKGGSHMTVFGAAIAGISDQRKAWVAADAAQLSSGRNIVLAVGIGEPALTLHVAQRLAVADSRYRANWSAERA
jgi:hypothetical protein